MGKVVDLMEELIYFYLKRIRVRSEIRYHRYFEFGNLTCVAVVSFKSIKTLAGVTVISSYRAGSSVLARGVCARIYCNKGNKQYSNGIICDVLHLVLSNFVIQTPKC